MIKWKRQSGQYSNGWNGYVNKYIFFTIHYACGFKSEDRKGIDNQLSCRLPGIKRDQGLYKINDAKKKAELILEFWLTKCNFTIKRIK